MLSHPSPRPAQFEKVFACARRTICSCLVACSIVLLFCGSKKSLASGLPMALVFFPAATVGVIMLPLMIFHQIQLFVCAIIASRMSRTVPAS